MAVQNEIAIQAINLRKTYREGVWRRRQFQALNGVSLEVQRGSIFGLLGPNGAGKTTFVKTMMGIIRRTAGSVTVFGYPAGTRKARQLIGYLPEKLSLPNYLTGFQALAYCGGLSGLSGRQIREKRDHMFSLVGLDGWGHTRISKYSKGMVQRLGLAQAMIHQPQLLVLDEPTDGLDPKARAGVREILQRLCQLGTTVFLNSHLLQEVEVLCRDVAILSEGNLKYCGPVAGIEQFLRGGADKTATLRVRFLVSGTASMLQSIILPEGSPAGWNPIGFSPTDIREESGSSWVITEQIPDQTRVDQRVDLLRRAGLSLHTLLPERITLEDAFLQLVGHSSDAPDVKAADAQRGLVQAGKRSG